jgi:prepilin-type N-terminal cleavage/methylation domain-containing protein
VVRRSERALRVRGGFTLIEILAVVVILLLIAVVVIPRAGGVTSRSVLDDGQQLAAAVDFARGRAVATGRTHRVVIDLDGAAYWIEALPAPSEAEATLAWAELDPLPLDAPREADDTTFAPLPGTPGDATSLRAAVRFAGVETESGAVESGLAALEFAPDGATPATRVWLQSGGEARVRVDVATLADPTRVRFDDAES